MSRTFSEHLEDAKRWGSELEGLESDPALDRVGWRPTCLVLANEVEALRADMARIASIRNDSESPDWAEIEAARAIANEALRRLSQGE